MCSSVAQYHASQLQEVSSKFSSVRPCLDLIGVKIYVILETFQTHKPTLYHDLVL